MVSVKGNKDEIEIWKHGWKFNYLIGQLNFVAHRYGKKLTACIENKYYLADLQAQKAPGVQLINKKISTELASELLKHGKVIVYLDNYYLQGILHAPHFVVALRKAKNKFVIADPYDGKQKSIPMKVMVKAIGSLRGHLKYSPVLVALS